ncbi:MAG: hypothetical protein A4E72_00846 [Syntrophus sp. PtaU1.Bin208]|nr:MAG: hypothetical protein A4E72_00846 [Syntrophus sp. PtaU1.Bin208]
MMGDGRMGHSEGDNSAVILKEAVDILHSYYGAGIGSLFVERLVVGVFFTGVKLSNGCGGVAYTPPETVAAAGCNILRESSSPLHGMPVQDVLSGAMQSPFAEIIRLAAINALSVPLFQEGRYALCEGNDLSDVSHLFTGRRICMVGAIIPLLKRLRELGVAKIQVIDYKKESQSEVESGGGEFVPPEFTANTLAQCDAAVFTGATVANGTIESLFRLVPQEAVVAVVGPTAGFVPEPLFRRSVALVGTAVVTDSDAALEIIAEGDGAYRLFGRCFKKINVLNQERIEQLKRRDNEQRATG